MLPPTVAVIISYCYSNYKEEELRLKQKLIIFYGVFFAGKQWCAIAVLIFLIKH
jgi:hypothetical protein